MKIDPKIQYCQCGHTWKPKTRHKILMLIFGSYSRICPQCQAVMEFKLMNHVVKTNSKKVLNERIWENG